MTARRRLNADTIRIETEANTVFFYNAYDKLGSVSQELRHGEPRQQVFLTDKALDDLYEALKVRAAHQEFLANKYGANA